MQAPHPRTGAALPELLGDRGPAPAIQQVTLGGEAVPEQLFGELRAIFTDARISQIYAASEFGSSGSVRDEHNGLPAAVLERDEGDDVAFKIVAGQLWARSRLGMLAYYGEPAVDPDGWRATGDLVEVVGDRILFRGRTSDVINVGGVKVHPLQVEERVAAVPGVALARVFGRLNPLTGAVVAVEVIAAPGTDSDAVVAGIRAACADLPAAAIPRSVRLVDNLKMTGYKIVRGKP